MGVGAIEETTPLERLTAGAVAGAMLWIGANWILALTHTLTRPALIVLLIAFIAGAIIAAWKYRPKFTIAVFTLAVLIFAVSRPLAGGWVGRAASGKADTTIILLDRSPSMQQQGAGTVVSKLDAGRHQLARTLATLGPNRWVLKTKSQLKPGTDLPLAIVVVGRAEG